MDLLTDSTTDDLVIENGDFVIANVAQTDLQQAYYIMSSNYNSFKNFPFYALNLVEYQNGNIRKEVLESKIRQSLKRDGYTRIELNVDDLKDIKVDARRI